MASTSRIYDLQNNQTNSCYFLSVHHGPVSLLPSEPAALAELHPSLPQLQRLLCQSPADPGQAGQRILLGPAPKLRKHVRKRLLPKASKALQGKTSKELFNTYLSYSINVQMYITSFQIRDSCNPNKVFIS